MNHAKWVLQKYPVNAYGMRDGLSGDTGIESVQYSSSPPQPKIASYAPDKYSISSIISGNTFIPVLFFISNAGVYNEQFEVSSKIPFELVGEGSPGAVVLIMYFDQNAATGRFSNLVLRAPWFTGCVLKVIYDKLDRREVLGTNNFQNDIKNHR